MNRYFLQTLVMSKMCVHSLYGGQTQKLAFVVIEI